MAISQVEPAPIGQHMTSSEKLTRYLPIFLTAVYSLVKNEENICPGSGEMKSLSLASSSFNGGTGASSNNDNAVVIIGLMTSIRCCSQSVCHSCGMRVSGVGGTKSGRRGGR
jgi:hypothetical protein